jgi:hypothetical protein
MKTRIVPVLFVAALGFAACASDSDSPAADDSLPPVPDDYQHPTAEDEVVVEYAEVGGFVPREFAFQQTPNVLVSGDGRVFGPGAQIAIFPGPLLPAVQVQPITEDGIQAILAAADEAGLLQDIEYEQPTNVADASTARVVINVNGETYVHEAYALGLALPGEEGGQETSPERRALADFIAELNDLTALVGADALGEQTIFEASEYGIEALVVDDLSAYGSSEQAELVGGHAAELVVVDLDPAEAAASASTLACGLIHLGDEHAAHRRATSRVQALDVAGELFDPVDLAAALHLDRHRGADGVAAHQVDRADRGGVLATHEREPVLDRVREAASSSCRWASTPSFCRPGSSPSSWAVSLITSWSVIVSVSPFGLVTVQHRVPSRSRRACSARSSS